MNEGKQKVAEENDETRAHLNSRMMAIDAKFSTLRMAACRVERKA